MLFSGFTQAQTAPADTVFPYRITLVSPDSSTEVSTRTLLPTGRVTVIAFWLTTCPPCRAELDVYARNYADWQQQAAFRLLAVSTDFPNRFRHIATRLRDENYPFEVWWDRHRGFSRVLPGALNGLPQVFIFDRHGRLAWHHKGFRPGDEAEMFARVLELQKD